MWGLIAIAKSFTAVLAAAELLPVVELLLTVALSLSVPAVVPAMRTETVAVAFTGNCPRLQVKLSPTRAAHAPWLAVAFWKVPLLGSESVKATAVAISGPVLVIVKVNVAGLPMPTGLGLTVACILRVLTPAKCARKASLPPLKAA